MKTHFRYSFCLLLASLPMQARAQVAVDLILIHGKIWTENPQQPEAEAVAVLGNHIAGVGSSTDMLKLTGPATRVIELGGKRVVPGFNDSHVHFVDGGESLASVQLGDTGVKPSFTSASGTSPRHSLKEHGYWKAIGTTSHGLPRVFRPIK